MARAVAERLRRRIAEAPVEAEAARIPVTASFGMATLAEGERSVEPALARADDAVYRAKRAGRNAVAAAP